MEVKIVVTNGDCSVCLGDSQWPRAVSGLTPEQAVTVKTLIEHAQSRAASSAFYKVKTQVQAAIDEVCS